MRYPSENWFRNKYGEPEEPMTPNQIIHEARGLCWHKFDNKRVINGYPEQLCSKCGQPWDWHCGTDILDYTKWEYYGPMIEEMMKQDWWSKFTDWFWRRSQLIESDLCGTLLNPLRGTIMIAEFLKERKN